MTYKTVFSVITDEALMADTLAPAEAVAEACNGHLEVLCLGVDRMQAGYYYGAAAALALQDIMGRVTQEAQGFEAQVRAKLKDSTVLWTIERAVASMADIGRHVAARARFSDLVVLPLPYGEACGIEMEAVVEGALFAAGVPVIAVPQGRDVSLSPSRVVLAWNESAEALRAARAALPILKAADAVHVVVIDPPQHGPNRSDPGGMLSQYLARHGVKAEIDVLTKTLPRVSEVLNRHVRDVGADMVVMGAYGHSRFRESILGGATRNMLELAEVPVFLAH